MAAMSLLSKTSFGRGVTGAVFCFKATADCFVGGNDGFVDSVRVFVWTGKVCGFGTAGMIAAVVGGVVCSVGTAVADTGACSGAVRDGFQLC